MIGITTFSRGRVALVLLAIAAVTAIWWARRPAPAIAYGFPWPAGARYVYQLDWATHDRVVLGVGDGAPMASELALGGELTLRSYGQRDGDYLVGMTFAPRTQRVMALGAELVGADPATDGALRDHEAILVVAPTGEVRSVRFAFGDPALWKTIAQTLAAELSTTLPATPARAWSATADDALGTAHVDYTPRAATELARRRTGYDRLLALPTAAMLAGTERAIDSDHQLGFAAGHLASLDEHDHFEVTRRGDRVMDHQATLALALLRVEPDAAPAPEVAAFEARTLGVPVVTADARAHMLAERAAGMTGDQLINELYMHAAGGLGDDPAWMWRATGLLLQHPELCEDLVRAFADDDMSVSTRHVIVDVLTGAGNVEAQTALRTVLAGAAAHADPQYGLLLQRISLLADPQPDTIAFLTQTRAQATAEHATDLARATDFALGAATRQLAAHDPAAAAAYNRILVDDLGAARAPADRAAALRALGNAARPDNVPLITAAAARL